MLSYYVPLSPGGASGDERAALTLNGRESSLAATNGYGSCGTTQNVTNRPEDNDT